MKRYLILFLVTFIFIFCGPTEEEMLIIDEAVEICADSRQALKKTFRLIDNYEDLTDKHFLWLNFPPSNKSLDEYDDEFSLYLDKEWEKINKLSNELNKLDLYEIPAGVLPNDKEIYHREVKDSLEDAKKAVFYYLQIIDSMRKDIPKDWFGRFPSQKNNIVTEEKRQSNFKSYRDYSFNYEKYEQNLVDYSVNSSIALNPGPGRKCYLEN